MGQKDMLNLIKNKHNLKFVPKNFLNIFTILIKYLKNIFDELHQEF